MVNVKIRVIRKSGMNEIDELFESTALSDTIVRPAWFIPGSVSIYGNYAEKKRESPRRFEKGMPFEVEDDVASGALGESRESTPVFNRKLSPGNLIGPLTL
jgi:hypothetical protein